MTSGLGAAVAGELEVVDRVVNRDRTREIHDERNACLERADEDRLATFVVGGDFCAELQYAASEVGSVEVDLADPGVERCQDALRRPYLAAMRSKSRS
jgi:hypothetical protein